MDASIIVPIVSGAITAGSAVAVAIISNTNRKSTDIKLAEQKQRDAEEALAEVNRNRQIEELTAAIHALDKKVDDLQNEVIDLRKQVKEMHQLDESVQRDLTTLHNQYERNSHYVHQLANVVVVMATGIRDQHLDGNITAAVDSFRAFEAKELESLMSQAHMASKINS